MYGLVNQAIEDLVIATRGEATWELVKSRAEVDDPMFLGMQLYDDKVTYDLVAAASVVLDIPEDEILRLFGRHWILYTAREGYGDLLDISGNTFLEFIGNLDNLHARISAAMPELTPPSFQCIEKSPTETEIRYFSQRKGLAPMVVGLLEGLAEKFHVSASIRHLQSDQPKGFETFIVRFHAE